MSAFFPPDSLMRRPAFRNYIFGSAMMAFAWTMLNIIVGWQIYAYTKDELALGWIGLSEAIPFIALALFGGYYADIVDRRKLIVSMTAGFMLTCLGLTFIAFRFAAIVSQWGLMPVYLLIGLTGVFRSFYSPARAAYASQLVEPHEYVKVSTHWGIAYETASVTGPMIGGLVYGFWSAEAAYIIVSLSALAAVLFFLTIPSIPMPERKVREGLLKSVREGLKFVFKQEALLGAMGLDMLAVLFGGAVSMLPAFADQVLHCGSEGLGFLRAAPGIGAILMGFYLSRRPPGSRAGQQLLIAIVGFGLSTIVFGLSTNFYLSLAALLAVGAFDAVSVVIRGTIVQLFSPNDMRGRVDSVNKMFIGSSNEIGAFESGLAASLFGLVPSVVGGACITIGVVGVFALKMPKLRALKF